MVIATLLLVILSSKVNVSAEEIQYSENLIPKMTNNTSPSGKASASSNYQWSGGTFYAYLAFNHTTKDLYDAWASTSPTGWLAYEFNEEKCISKYVITPRTVTMGGLKEQPRDWNFEAFDETTQKWIVLDNQKNITDWEFGVEKEFTFKNESYYKKYRLNITANGGYVYVTVGELQMMETVNKTPDKKLKVVLEVNEELQLSVDEDLDENLKMIWTSSKESVATVDANGVVTAVAPGNTTITVKSEDGAYTDYINVLVVKEDEAKEYRLAVDLKVGKSSRLTVDDLTDTIKVNWESLDSSVATVTSKGKVTAVSKGLTIIIAKDEEGNEIGQIYIRVR